MRTRARDNEPVALDVPYLSTTYGVPEDEIQTLLDAPTAELVNAFLGSLMTKGHEYDELKSDKLKVDVELENTVRTSETKVKAQKATVTKHVKEVEELRTKLNEAESARETLSSELEQLRSSATGSTAETQTLRQRIETLQASNRDALALVESKSTEKDRVATELSEQHSKLLALRRDISQLEERNQSLENAASSQKFKEQSLQQEIDLLKRTSEWNANELQTRTQEHTKFRKERNARVANLQRELEDANASVETLKRTETNLRQRLEEVQGKADEAFAKIASLQEDAARKEQSWKTELDSNKRLAELQAQNAATHKARLHDVSSQLDLVKEEAANEIGRIQSEIETERSDKEQAEAKVAELELKVEQLEQRALASRPGTPMNNGAFDPATPGRMGSPFNFSGSARKLVGKLPFTNTEYWTKYNDMQQDLEAERRRTQKLSQAMDEMIQDVENRGPELLELREDQQRLEEEVLSFSNLLEEANSTRDGALKDVERWQAEAESRASEGEVLRQQLRDLSAQIKILLVEIQSKNQGLDDMSGEERFQIEQAARGELEEWSQNESFTNQLISQRLVIYRDINELQEKNEAQLKMLRFQAEQLEGEEARKKNAESEANAQAAEELRQQVSRYKDELQSTATQIDSYIKERDMFRRMLQHRGSLQPDSDLSAMFGQSIAPATPARNGMDAVAQTPRSKDAEDMGKMLKEQQTVFDQFRTEAAQDRKTLKDQVDALGREKSALQADLAHWKSQKTLAEERLQMLMTNYNGLRNENGELQKRSQTMAESAAKQDLRTQQVAEELVEARSMAESLRNENANTKAEKELWKRIEGRLTEDNKNLMDERSRLNKLVADLQNLQNERELSDSETRRRLQTRIESMEAELEGTKKRLEQELDDSRKASLRREYEESQSRTRIDDLVKSLGNVREELAAAKTKRDELQSRVDEMKIELRSAEERVAALQPRPTPRAEPTQNGNHNEDEDELSAEQRHALEASDLRRELDLAKNDLESARQQVEQYRAIAQATEEELAGFNETSDQYKEETDRQITEKDARATELQQRVDDLISELNSSNNELSELRTKQDDVDRILNEQKAGLETEISRLKDDAERHAEEKKLYQEDLKAQAEIAQQAQQSYEDELVKHADAAKNAQSARTQYNALRTEVAGIRAEAEAAKASLERGEDSWTEQRDRFEKEFEDVKKRREDTDAQNRLLHQQMESFSTELTALRSGRVVSAGDGEEHAEASSGDGNIQEVIKYLRREKEIVDVQYELSMQEGKRLQEQLSYANAQLEETKQKLADERRQSTSRMAFEGSTERLTQTINELNLFRESSTTLRNEARQAREKLEEKSKEVERLLTEIEPLKGRVGELEGDVENKDGEIKLLTEDRDRWHERTQNIISKYNRVDPAEIEEMKSQLEELKAGKERLETEQAPLREQLEGAEQAQKEAVEANSKAFNARIDGLKEQAKEQNRRQRERITALQATAEAANGEKDRIQGELDTAKTELDQAKTALQQAQATSSNQPEEGQVVENNEADQSRATAAEVTAKEQSERAAALTGEVHTLQARVQELEGQVSTLQSQLDDALAQGEEGEIQPDATADVETLEKLKQDLAHAQEEVESLRANPIGQSATNAQPADGEKSVADQIAEEVAKLRTEMEEQHELAKQQMTKAHEERIENLKASLKKRLGEEKEKIREQFVQAHSADMQKLRDEHEAAMTKLKEDHQAELARLTQQGSAAVEKAETISAAVKPEPTATDVDEEQYLQMMKDSQRVRGIVNANINKRVRTETEKLNQTIAEKNVEIEQLKQGVTSAASDDEKEELQKKLAAAEEDKQKAIAVAVDQQAKKASVQVSMLGNVQAKLAVVRKAAQETPEKPVKEVWEVADKAKPAPKPPVAASPATAALKTALPSSPTQAQPSPVQPPAQSTSVTELTEAERLKQRQARFGTGPADAPTGQASSAPTSGIRPPSAAGTGSLSQPARRPSNVGPNPQAAAFAPAASTDGAVPAPTATRRMSQSNIGRGGLPQAARGGRASVSGAGSTPATFLGAASNGQPAQAAQRGGAQSSGIPRGGAGAAVRGAPRGRGGANTGQKRAHDGDDGGDGKRQRGGAGGGA